VSELGPNAYGEVCDPGRVTDCYLALPLAAEDGDGPGRVLVVAPRGLLHPAVPQHALVFPADLAEELHAWPHDTSASLTAELAHVAAAVVWCWQHGDLLGLNLPLEAGEDPRALTRPAMTLARAALRARLDHQVARARCRFLHPSSGHRAEEPFL